MCTATIRRLRPLPITLHRLAQGDGAVVAHGRHIETSTLASGIREGSQRRVVIASAKASLVSRSRLPPRSGHGVVEGMVEATVEEDFVEGLHDGVVVTGAGLADAVEVGAESLSVQCPAERK